MTKLYVSIWLGHNDRLWTDIILDDSVRCFWVTVTFKSVNFELDYPPARVWTSSNQLKPEYTETLVFPEQEESCGRLLSDVRVQHWLILCLQPDGWAQTITSTLS